MLVHQLLALVVGQREPVVLGLAPLRHRVEAPGRLALGRAAGGCSRACSHRLGHALGVLGQLGERHVGVDDVEAGLLERRSAGARSRHRSGPRAMNARSALWPSTATVTTWSPSAWACSTAAAMASPDRRAASPCRTGAARPGRRWGRLVLACPECTDDPHRTPDHVDRGQLGRAGVRDRDPGYPFGHDVPLRLRRALRSRHGRRRQTRRDRAGSGGRTGTTRRRSAPWRRGARRRARDRRLELRVRRRALAGRPPTARLGGAEGFHGDPRRRRPRRRPGCGCPIGPDGRGTGGVGATGTRAGRGPGRRRGGFGCAGRPLGPAA